MDGQRFDDLTRSLVAVGSRRRLLARITAAPLALLATLLADDTASAACRAYGKPCDRGRQCCSKTCSRRGKCVCPTGRTKCGTKSCCDKGQACVNGACKECKPGAIPDSCTGGKSCVSGTCHCPDDQHDCEGTCVSNNDVATCGNRCDPCPGFGQSTANVGCDSGTCTFSCQGRNFDVNGDEANGCEKADSDSAGATEANAGDLGSFACNQGGSFSGSIISDAREHPGLDGFDPDTGTTPDYWRAFAVGGFTCSRNVGATITTSGGNSPEMCYLLAVRTDQASRSVGVSGSGRSQSLLLPSGSYSSESLILFTVKKTCDTSVREDVSYTVTFNL